MHAVVPFRRPRARFELGKLVVGRLFSSYQITSTEKLWIITEADRSVTTLLLPSDY